MKCSQCSKTTPHVHVMGKIKEFGKNTKDGKKVENKELLKKGKKK